jgi:hypothetical protein
MKNKLSVIGLTVLFSLLMAIPALAAQYTSVTGELRDDKTHALWTYGADVEVFDCNTFATLGTQSTNTGTFNITITPSGINRAACVNVDFCAGPNGKPGDAAKGPFIDRTSGSGGTLNTGVYFTGTGPTAVGVEKFIAHSSNWLWLVTGSAILLAAAGLFVFLRSHQKA